MQKKANKVFIKTNKYNVPFAIPWDACRDYNSKCGVQDITYNNKNIIYDSIWYI